jgi:uncharacterized membrane protein
MNTSAARWRIYSILLLFIALKAIGNLALAWGMKRPAAGFLSTVFDPFVIAGVAALIFALLTRMALLSLADLSFVLPTTAIGYVIAAFLGKTFLSEIVTWQRWTGTILICIGAVLVGSDTAKTPENPK